MLASPIVFWSDEAMVFLIISRIKDHNGSFLSFDPIRICQLAFRGSVICGSQEIKDPAFGPLPAEA